LSELELGPLLALLEAGPQPWVLLIDGRSGAGKTVLAGRVADATGAALVSLDDVYPGWRGLAAGAAEVPRILAEGSWRSWDWAADRPGSAASVDLTGSVIVEGCGAISRASRPLADHAWWLEYADTAERRRRALARSGAGYEPHWDAWAAQEEAFAAAEDSRELATLILRPAAAPPPRRPAPPPPPSATRIGERYPSTGSAHRFG